MLFLFITQFCAAKLLLFYEKALSNRTNRLSNRTKVTDYITAYGKIDGRHKKSLPRG